MSTTMENATTTPDPLLRPLEAAKYLAIGHRTLERLASGGKIPFVRIGRMIRFDPKDLRAYVEQCRQGG